MDEETLRNIAGQLRQPYGEQGIEVGKKMNEGNRYMNLNAIEALAPDKADQILEIGMGNGFFVKDILGSNGAVRYCGCDFSPLMVEAARRNNERFVSSGRAEFFVAPADRLPFEDERFDRVFTVNTLYFWEDVAAIFSEIRRVLKPGGRVLIAIRPRRSMAHLPFVRHGFAMFSSDELSALVMKNNFSVAAIIEKEEPEQQIGGDRFRMETLIVIGEKK